MQEQALLRLRLHLNALKIDEIEFLRTVLGGTTDANRMRLRRQLTTEQWVLVCNRLGVSFEKFFPCVSSSANLDSRPTQKTAGGTLGDLESAKRSYASWCTAKTKIVGLYAFLPLCMLTEPLFAKRRSFLSLHHSQFNNSWANSLAEYYSDRFQFKESSQNGDVSVVLPKAIFHALLRNKTAGTNGRMTNIEHKAWLKHMRVLVHERNVRIRLVNLDPYEYRSLPDSLILFDSTLVSFNSSISEYYVDCSAARSQHERYVQGRKLMHPKIANNALESAI